MKKKVLSIMLLISLSLPVLIFICSCHGTEGLAPFEMPEELDEGRKYEITFWAKNDTNKTQTDIYAKAIEDFEEYYPNIKVNIRLYTDYGRIYNDVITNISTNTTPNVCITYPDHIATYITGSNIVLPLDDIIDDEKYGLGGSEVKFDSVGADEVIKKYLDELTVDGKQYGIPFMRSTEACYINISLLEKMGYELPDILTWDFIWEVSDAATAKNADGTYAVNGMNTMIPFIYKSTDNMMIQMLKQKNAGYSTSEGEVLLFNDTAKELLLELSEHVKKGSFSTFKISSYPGNFLNAGQCIFAIDSTAGATWIGKASPHSDISEESRVDFETAVRMIPQFDPENPVMISQGPSICVFNKNDSGEVLASWLFAQFLLTNSVQIAYSQTEGYVPVTSRAQNSEEYTDYLSRAGEDEDLHYKIKIEAAELCLENSDNTFITPVFNGSTSVRDAAGQLIENVTKSVRRKETVNSAYIDEQFESVRSLYRLDQSGGVKGASETPGSGPLPGASVALLSALAGVWLIIICYLTVTKVKKRSGR